ncbi:MAG: sugar ABC transporter substrate-binding protein [Acuticoccus sp.]
MNPTIANLTRAVAAAAVTAGLCAGTAMAADTRAALVPGGPHPYFAAWADAAAAAAEKFGVEAEYQVPPAWELSQQNELIESLVAQGFNAMLVFPGDASGTNATLGELKDFDIPSAALAGCTEAPTPALFCLGTDVYNSAYLGTKELIERMGGSGKIAHFTGFLVDPNTQLRIEAVQKAADEADGVEVMQVIADIDAPEPADEKINAFLAAQGDNVDGIVTTAWVPAVVAATSLRNLGDKRIKMVGIDHDAVVLEAIKDGFVDGTMLQNPYGQGYIGVYAMDLVRGGCTMKDDAPWQTTAQTDRFIDSGTAFVGADEVANYQEAMVRVTDDIMADFKEKYMNCPN